MTDGKKLTARRAAFIAASILCSAVLWIGWIFQSDLAQATARAATGSVLIATRCGPIEYQEAGRGVPLLMIHGSGGGHDQGMAFARPLAERGIHVIAISRFGYLRTPRPADASPEAQADANVCLLDALGIRQAGVLGASAGGPSAMQTAIRHPDRVSALVLVVPIAYKPPTVADSATPLSAGGEAILMRLIGSDFLFWAALRVARDQVIRYVLATPPELVAAASSAAATCWWAMTNGYVPRSAICSLSAALPESHRHNAGRTITTMCAGAPTPRTGSSPSRRKSA